MSTPERILMDVAHLEDELGVLSVYVHLDPRRQASETPPWRTEIGNALREIRQRVREEPQRDRTRIAKRLDELEPAIEGLLDPATSGRGRALFAGMASDEIQTVSVQAELPTLAVLGHAAHLGPLAELVARDRPVGIATVSRDALVVYDRRYGSIEPIARWTFDEQTSEWRELKGPAAANPALAQQTAPQRDRFDRRLEEHQIRFVVSLAERLDDIAARAEWDTLLLTGDTRLTAPLESALPPRSGRETASYELLLDGFTADQIGEAVLDELRSLRERREMELVQRTIDAARSGGPGALGLRRSLEALEEARVAELVIDAALAHGGSTPTPAEPGPDERAGVDPETLVHRTIQQSGSVRPVGPRAAELLRDHGGIAAVLRW